MNQCLVHVPVTVIEDEFGGFLRFYINLDSEIVMISNLGIIVDKVSIRVLLIRVGKGIESICRDWADSILRNLVAWERFAR